VIVNDFTPAEEFAGVRGLIFDCDGVLFDSYGANQLYYNLIRKGLGLEPMDPEQERYVHAHAVRESLARITPPERMDEAQAIRKTIDYRDLIPAMVPQQGLYPFLGWALASGYRLGVFTNRMTTMNLVVERFDLGPYFSPVLTAALVRPKPHPEGLVRILRQWGLAGREVAFLGDSHLDLDSARSAGVKFWAYGSETLDADLHIPDYFALRRAMARRLGAVGPRRLQSGRGHGRSHDFA
jgi:phosphoglycolate phosphatase